MLYLDKKTQNGAIPETESEYKMIRHQRVVVLTIESELVSSTHELCFKGTCMQSTLLATTCAVIEKLIV